MSTAKDERVINRAFNLAHSGRYPGWKAIEEEPQSEGFGGAADILDDGRVREELGHPLRRGHDGNLPGDPKGPKGEEGSSPAGHIVGGRTLVRKSQRAGSTGRRRSTAARRASLARQKRSARIHRGRAKPRSHRAAIPISRGSRGRGSIVSWAAARP